MGFLTRVTPANFLLSITSLSATQSASKVRCPFVVRHILKSQAEPVCHLTKVHQRMIALQHPTKNPVASCHPRRSEAQRNEERGPC
jgi:hypothetical protein